MRLSVGSGNSSRVLDPTQNRRSKQMDGIYGFEEPPTLAAVPAMRAVALFSLLIARGREHSREDYLVATANSIVFRSRTGAHDPEKGPRAGLNLF